MILTVILIEILLFIGMVGLFIYADCKDSLLAGILAMIMMIAFFIVPFAVGGLHGYVDYKESNDKDLARITSVTQEQTAFKTYYKIEVEYLTNTPNQEGVVQNKNIEKDTFYCYYEDKELVNKLKDNMYIELWIISGRKGGYETYKDFGTKLIKDIELKEN
ncbi:MAG: hypothetical protein HFJ47_01655 [Clostridia bacterium]|nr:hypothetical protein [Clostridia bacterium]